MSEPWIEERRDHAWRYFQIHASQRMTSFNFFIILCGLLTAGLAKTLEADGEMTYLGVLLGASMMTVSFVFWKLDQRVRYFIKLAEDALKEIEKAWSENESSKHLASAALFSLEEHKTSSMRSQRTILPSQWHLSYSQCFGVMYWLFSILGFSGIVRTIWVALAT